MRNYDLLKFLYSGLRVLAAWVFILVFFDGGWDVIRVVRLVVLAGLVLAAVIFRNALSRRHGRRERRVKTKIL